MRRNKGVFIFLVTALLCYGATSAQENEMLRPVYKRIYKDQFRLEYTRALLRKAYNQSAAVNEILNDDHSGFTEPILRTDDRRVIDSLAEAHSRYLHTDSAQSIGRRAEGAEGKQTLGFLIRQLRSDALEKLIERRYQLFRREQLMGRGK